VVAVLVDDYILIISFRVEVRHEFELWIVEREREVWAFSSLLNTENVAQVVV